MTFIERVTRFEKRLQDDMINIFCPTHLSLGQEMVADGLHECLKKGDWVYSHHRNHGHYLACGGSEEKLWDEIHGLESGMNGGFSGSQGFSDESVNFHASAIVGGLVGVATGTAYALKMNFDGHIAVCILGDGGTEAGVFWESLNFAALNKLPITYIVENNSMSVDARIEERQATLLRPRVEAFGIECFGSIMNAVNITRTFCKPTLCEIRVKLECDHLNLSTLLPSLGLK